ncbi:MAG TPA: ATP:cob(I)alamin adenosyltransferase [Candidatus Hydrogenedentes bacterium]|nr:ATP:cob(I)alamin adenosyltransferase [Candidatus Hydrogenedentota bacterium]HQE83279.1 ATP:cob(I)alamin adenosyltransferase [Candidatus Hydrogenedentota bacterium]HQH50805.1 ATP:cob(I)alamin adenosyltransferase [Candidatus Hydrogenedentota bacterium]HQM47743.1 ATP:cob(I)alamin adenosyltransferase [Candidatus Hydrogenedentota bacterium]
MRSKVTTKQGDQGETIALNGETYPKSHPIICCIGALDEARVQTALLRQVLASQNDEALDDILRFLHWVLHTFFIIGTDCSDPAGKHPECRRGKISEKELIKLEDAQLRLETELKLPNAFIVGASTVPAAHADVACTAVRRLERAFAEFRQAFPEFDAGTIPAFLNRLSDYLFVLARWLERGNHAPVDYSVLDT